MRATVEFFRNRVKATSWQKYYDPMAPKMGDIAPDFKLRDIYGHNPVRLSDFREKRPVVLIFGSFT